MSCCWGILLEAFTVSGLDSIFIDRIDKIYFIERIVTLRSLDGWFYERFFL
ncbi:MAG: hypothetical protein H7A24_12570 [Leptospiraceae bacterium]|nr:hypothetical protein [Leptospiraceae bacterium]